MMKGKLVTRTPKSRFTAGMLVGFVFGTLGATATAAVANVFTSWRTESGVVIASGEDRFLQEGNPSSPTFSAQCPLIAPPAKLLMALDMAARGDRSQLGLIVDVRSKTEYLAGHIPGAVWIADWFDMAEPESLDKIDKALAEHVAAGGANKLVVYCHTGHKGGYVAGMLGALGYPAHNLKFGYVMGWQRNLAPVGSATEGILTVPGPVETDAVNIVGEPKTPAEIFDLVREAQARVSSDEG